jgi:hypothetical protein
MLRSLLTNASRGETAIGHNQSPANGCYREGCDPMRGSLITQSCARLLSGMLLLARVASSAQEPARFTYKPPGGGYVPDGATAIKIAVAVWEPIYGGIRQSTSDLDKWAVPRTRNGSLRGHRRLTRGCLAPAHPRRLRAELRAKQHLPAAMPRAAVLVRPDHLRAMPSRCGRHAEGR